MRELEFEVGNGIELKESTPADDELKPPETLDEGKLPVPVG
jgi:hypothetical protein